MKVVHNSYNPDTRDMTKIYALAPCGRSCIYFCHIPRNRVITIKYLIQNSQAVKKSAALRVSAPNSPELLLLKFLPLTYHHSHFLAATLDFTTFFTIAFLRAALFFYSLAVLD